MKTERTGHTEAAPHLTSRLGRDTERGTIFLGNINCFYETGFVICN